VNGLATGLSLDVIGIAAIQQSIYQLLLVACIGLVPILHLLRDIRPTTFAVYVTVCDLEKSLLLSSVNYLVCGFKGQEYRDHGPSQTLPKVAFFQCITKLQVTNVI